MSNLNFIKENGIETFAEQQKKRIGLLEIMIKNFDDGRSKSFFCRAAGFPDLKKLEDSIEKANQKIRSDNINPDDKKTIAGILKDIINKNSDKGQVHSGNNMFDYKFINQFCYSDSLVQVRKRK